MCNRVRGLRPPRGNDPVRLLVTDVMQSMMLEPVLEESGIPYSRADQLGWSLTMKVGSRLDSIAYYVPYGAYDACRELLMQTFEPEGSILIALRANDPQGE